MFFTSTRLDGLVCVSIPPSTGGFLSCVLHIDHMIVYTTVPSAYRKDDWRSLPQNLSTKKSKK